MTTLNNYITHRSTTNLTVADVFREHWEAYRQKHRVSPQQAKVVGSIMSCRTPALGGHCNQCQKYERAQWVEKQKVIQLPILYFHIVFTSDHGLNPLFRQNKRVLYDLLFHVVCEVLQKKAKEELGCELGITAVLHTWGQQLEEHHHLHGIVTGGGVSLDTLAGRAEGPLWAGGQRWVKPKGAGYLLDVVKLSAAYRDEWLGRIEEMYRTEQISLAGVTAEAVVSLLSELRAKKWEVFIKPFDNPDTVIEYLSRYVHQVAISNYRLESIENGQVRFRYYALRRTRRGATTGNGRRWARRVKRKC